MFARMFLTRSSWTMMWSLNQSNSPVESMPVERITLKDSTAGMKPRLLVRVRVLVGA
jgi:hypothetical protein